MLPTSKTPYVSYRGLKKSARLLYDFSYFYFPLHDVPQRKFFEYYPLLAFVEALVYEADELVESGQADQQEYKGVKPVTQMKNIDLALLKELNLYDPLIEKELEQGEEYYRLENQMMHDKEVTYDILVRACERRTFDMRVLHRIFFRLLEKPYDERLFELIRPMEILADIEDDIEQYKDDVASNSFNTYRMFVKLYGKEGKQKLEAEVDKYVRQVEANLKSLPWRRRLKFTRLLLQFRKDHPEQKIPEPILEWDEKK